VSYDLMVLAIGPDGDADAAFERLEETHDSAPDDEGRRRVAEIADAIMERFPHLERGDAGDSVELTSPSETPFQLLISHDQAGANVPYWGSGERAEATYRELLDALQIVRERTGWSIYDPQLGRVVDEGDLVEILGKHDEGVELVRSIASEREREERPRGLFRRLFGG
jgi:hypothetical protein